VNADRPVVEPDAFNEAAFGGSRPGGIRTSFVKTTMTLVRTAIRVEFRLASAAGPAQNLPNNLLVEMSGNSTSNFADRAGGGTRAPWYFTTASRQTVLGFMGVERACIVDARP